ncbi:AbfB domain-containing protein [Streptomyces sediminimaris]|uniref:AbfB domain-containing protein n=1 Tax=Streptomyces sediminimaris TaxID=3383721 RepID=UPI00399C393E
MPDTTPEPPARASWQDGWAPDTSRAPGTRRLWLAGALAVATIVACVTAIGLMDKGPDDPSSASGDPSSSVSATGPGLISFATPSAAKSATTPAARGGPPSARTAAPSAPAHPRASAAGGSGSAEPPATPASSPGRAKPSAAYRSVRSVNYPDRFWHVSGDLVRLDPVASAPARRDATFTLVKGLADRSCYSFATAGGRYLRHRDFLLRSERDDGSALFEQDATFCPRTSSYPGAVMLESVNYPGRFLRHRNFQLELDPYQGSDLYRADSSFRIVDGVA